MTNHRYKLIVATLSLLSCGFLEQASAKPARTAAKKRRVVKPRAKVKARKKPAPAFPRAMMLAPLSPQRVRASAPREIPVYHPDRRPVREGEFPQSVVSETSMPATAPAANDDKAVSIKAEEGKTGEAVPAAPPGGAATAPHNGEPAPRKSRGKVILFPPPPR